MSPGSPYTTVTVGSECAVGKGRGWLMPASSLMMDIVARQSWYGVQSTMGGGVSWSWWMEPWTGISTSRSWGIKYCHGWQGYLDIILCMSKTMPHPIQHVTRQPFWTNGMLRSWSGQLGVQTWTQLSMFGVKCQSGSETWMTPFHHSWAKQAVRQAWAAGWPGRVRTQVESMPRRVRALLTPSVF